MKFKITPLKIIAVLIFGVAAVSFGLSGLDSAANRYEIQNRRSESYISRPVPASNAPLSFLETETESAPLARLFQLMFILFFISPPIIAVLLFLIWKELKKRNEMN